MSYSDVVAADQRLVMLQALEEDPGYSHNEHVLKSMLEAVGHGVSRDSLRTNLAWLEEQGLVHLTQVGTTAVAKITGRGSDVARGATRVPGVARPRLD